MKSLTAPQTHEIPAHMTLWRRLAWAGFLFFLIKGLLWLSAPVVFYLLI